MAPTRPYPRRTLEDALAVAIALKEKNGGNPWSPEDVANALGVSKTNNNFFYLTAASRDYGLTSGTRDASEIALAETGTAIVYAPSAEDEHAAKVKAFRSVELFDRVLRYFRGSKLPEMQYLTNTLKTQFSLEEAVHEEFVDVFSKNCRYLGIGATFDPDAPVTPFGRSERGESSETVVVAEPTGGRENGAPVCFVIMPFSERNEEREPGFFNEVLNQILVPAATKAGFEVRTALRQGSDVIQSTIVNDLLDADLVLADLTDHNPNVLFELGLRMAEEKPVVLVRAKGTGRIFDVDNLLRVADYDPNVWPSTVEADVPALADHIAAGWESRDDGRGYVSILRSRIA